MRGKQAVRWITLVTLLALALAATGSGITAAPLAQEPGGEEITAIACGDSAICSGPSTAVYVRNNGSGEAIYGENITISAGTGVRGRGNPGVYGTSAYAAGVRGVSYNAKGVKGESTNNDGVYAASVNGVGLRAMSTNNWSAYLSNGLAIGGSNWHGIQISSSGWAGIWVNSSGFDAFEVANAGRHGLNVGNAADHGVYVVGSGNEAVYATTSNTGSNVAAVRGNNASDDAVWGDGGTYTFGYGGAFYGTRGVYANADGASTNYAGVFEDAIYVISGGCTGCTMAYMAINSGDVPLETGDLVAITGMAPSPEGESQIMAVRQAGGEAATSVVGVVDRRYVMPPDPLASGNEAVTYDDPAIGTFVDGPIAPGQYLRIIVQGIATVKVDASQGAIQPGDLLVSSSASGFATKGVEIQYGTLVGKALEPLAEGKGFIQVLVDLQ